MDQDRCGSCDTEASSAYRRRPTVRVMKGALRGRQSWADLKPPQAAVAKYHGGERLRKRWDKIPAGMVEGGERKQTADELSKTD